MRLRDSLADTGKHYLVYGLGMAASKLASFVLIPLYTRVFPTAEYGIFTTLTITLMVISTASQLGVNSAVVRSYYDYADKQGRARVFGTAFMLLLASSSVCALAMGLFSRDLSRLVIQSSDLGICFWLLGATLITDGIFSLYTSELRAAKKSVAFSIVNIAKLLVTCIAAILFVAVLKMGVRGAVTANAISSAISCIAIMPVLIARCDFHYSKKEASKLLRFGIPLIPMSLSAAAIASADRYFLLHMCGSAETAKAIVGVYALIYNYSNLFRIGIVEPLYLVLLPQIMAVRGSSYADTFYSRILNYYMLFSGFLILLMTVAYQYVVSRVSGHSYTGSALVVWLILLSLLFIGSTRLLGVGMTFARKTSFSAMFYTTAAVINIGLNFLLIPSYQMMGAAIATVSSAAILPVCYYLGGAKYYKIDYEWMVIIRNAMLFLLLSGIYFALPRFGLSDWLINTVELSIVVLYFPLAIALKIIRREEVRTVVKMIKSKNGRKPGITDSENEDIRS